MKLSEKLRIKKLYCDQLAHEYLTLCHEISDLQMQIDNEPDLESEVNFIMFGDEVKLKFTKSSATGKITAKVIS
jgi:hypothetical protein